MPVAIVGSGRCGTSMVTRMLNFCGLYIGGSSEMFDAADSCNPTGYWEHRAFREINNQILEHYSGNELLPPVLKENWEFDESLDPLVIRAKEVISVLSRHGRNWGWKDPRTSLTLPFWQRLIPDLKVIVCVRNPLEVVRSFEDLLAGYGSIGNFLGIDQGLMNWYTFNASVIAATTPENRMFTFYEDYFPEFREPLSQLLQFAGLNALEKGSALDRRVSGLHDPSLKHHHRTTDELLDDQATPGRVKDLYLSILNSGMNPLAGETGLQEAAHKYASLPTIDIACYDAAKIQKIMFEYIKKETIIREAQAVLLSRTHRIATKFCSFLIWRKQAGSRIKAAVSDTVNDVLAVVDTHHRIPPARWY